MYEDIQRSSVPNGLEHRFCDNLLQDKSLFLCLKSVCVWVWVCLCVCVGVLAHFASMLNLAICNNLLTLVVGGMLIMLNMLLM